MTIQIFMENYPHTNNHEASDDESSISKKWQDVMESVEADQQAPESDSNAEAQKKVGSLFESIQSFKEHLMSEMGASSEASAVEAMDEVLVSDAKDTITSASEDGVITPEEAMAVEDAVTAVIIEGASEEAGLELSAGKNPILELSTPDTRSALDAAIDILEDEGVTLPDGENISELAREVIESQLDADPSAERQGKRPSLHEMLSFIRSQENERSGEYSVRPRAELICDHDHIENQRIDIIGHNDTGITELRFKLRDDPQDAERISEIFAGIEPDDFSEHETPNGVKFYRGKFTYESTTSENEICLSGAKIIEANGIKIFISDPDSYFADGEMKALQQDEQIMSAKGLIKIELPPEATGEDSDSVVSDILKDYFGIDGALDEVSGESEQDYKLARYSWVHKIQGELTPEQQEAASKLVREEVFPGYSTLVEPGKHSEYLERCAEDLRAFHQLSNGDAESIYRILTQGLMSTTERHSRGIFSSGMSSGLDMKTGGADSVFTRVGRKPNRDDCTDFAIVIFSPKLFDRTDWYSYPADKYGSTKPDDFDTRWSPDTLIDGVLRGYTKFGNEQMFRTGIGPSYIENIQVPYDDRDRIIKELTEMGLTEFGGKPIDEVIIAAPPRADGKTPIKGDEEGPDNYVPPYYKFMKKKSPMEQPVATKEDDEEDYYVPPYLKSLKEQASTTNSDDSESKKTSGSFNWPESFNIPD